MTTKEIEAKYGIRNYLPDRQLTEDEARRYEKTCRKLAASFDAIYNGCGRKDEKNDEQARR